MSERRRSARRATAKNSKRKATDDAAPSLSSAQQSKKNKKAASSSSGQLQRGDTVVDTSAPPELASASPSSSPVSVSTGGPALEAEVYVPLTDLELQNIERDKNGFFKKPLPPGYFVLAAPGTFLGAKPRFFLKDTDPANPPPVVIYKEPGPNGRWMKRFDPLAIPEAPPDADLMPDFLSNSIKELLENHKGPAREKLLEEREAFFEEKAQKLRGLAQTQFAALNLAERTAYTTEILDWMSDKLSKLKNNFYQSPAKRRDIDYKLYAFAQMMNIETQKRIDELAKQNATQKLLSEDEAGYIKQQDMIAQIFADTQKIAEDYERGITRPTSLFDAIVRAFQYTTLGGAEAVCRATAAAAATASEAAFKAAETKLHAFVAMGLDWAAQGAIMFLAGYAYQRVTGCMQGLSDVESPPHSLVLKPPSEIQQYFVKMGPVPVSPKDAWLMGRAAFGPGSAGELGGGKRRRKRKTRKHHKKPKKTRRRKHMRKKTKHHKRRRVKRRTRRR